MSKLGRNDPCPCGSGKKYKKCCLASGLYEGVSESSSGAVSAHDQFAAEEEQEFEDLVEEPDIPEPVREYDETEPVGDCEVTPVLLHYPKCDPELPDLPAPQQALVDAWWKTNKPLFRNMDPDAMIGHIVGFMEEHPELFVYLGLEHEVLFELGAEMGRRKDWSRFAKLLERIRKEHPEMYVRSFSYYDYDLIIQRIIDGQFEAITPLFNYFHQFPDGDPDNARKVVELLAWTGRQDELFAFAKPLAVPMWTSPEVIGGWFMLRWLVFAQYVPILDTVSVLDASAHELVAALDNIEIPNAPEFDIEFLRREIRFCRETPTLWDIKACKKKRDIDQFYHDIRWNYCAFLHNKKGWPWARADLLAERLESYWGDRPEGKRPKEAFRLDENSLSSYLAKTSRDLFHIDGLRAGTTIEAVWFFVEYLEVHSWIAEDQARSLREICHRLFGLVLGAVDSTDPLPRLMPKLPEMVCLRV